MSYWIKNSSWNLKEAFCEGCAICRPPVILGSENFGINRVNKQVINRKRSCENKDSCEKIYVLK